MKGIKLGTFQQPNEMNRIMGRKEDNIPLLEEAKLEKKNSDERLKDPVTKTIVMDLLEHKGISTIERMVRKDLQNEASNNESQRDYTAYQLLADCLKMQEILDEKDKKELEKYN